MTNGKPRRRPRRDEADLTLGKPLKSVDLNTKATAEAGLGAQRHLRHQRRVVVMENVIAFEIARAFLEKFGGIR
jgi:chorismate synthase